MDEPLDIILSAGFAVYVVSPDSALQDTAWFNREGEADYTFNLPFDVYPSLGQVPGVEVVSGPSMTNLFGMLNHRRLSPEVRGPSCSRSPTTTWPKPSTAVRAHGPTG